LSREEEERVCLWVCACVHELHWGPQERSWELVTLRDDAMWKACL